MASLMSKKFQRRIENFVCEKCGADIHGNGYTDHCPNCLWGKHVDVHPGDRMSHCGGRLKPIRVELDHGKNIIMYRCEKCGHKFRVKSTENDNFEALLKINKFINHKS